LNNPVKSERWTSPRIRATAIIFNKENEILLLKHVRDWGEFLVLPGGGVEDGEAVESALEREVREELGVNCIAGKLIAAGELIKGDRHVLDLFYLAEIDRFSDFVLQRSEGISQAEWVGTDQIGGLFLLPFEIVPILSALPRNPPDKIQSLGKYDLIKREDLPDNLFPEQNG
jgi:8-oxo-dGTP pyrophosphatase MutT (NUDIX family)